MLGAPGHNYYAKGFFFENMVQIGAFWCILCSDCVLKN